MSTFFSGRVHSILFSDSSKEFYILRMVLDEVEGFSDSGGRTTTVRGVIPAIQIEINTWFGFEAKWVNHDKYGRQLFVTKAPALRGAWDTHQASETLTGSGVPAVVVNRLIHHFGDGLVRVLDSFDPTRLVECPGMSLFSSTHVVEQWKHVKSLFQSLDFLDEAGVPKGKVNLVWQMFGEDVETILTQNPWRLVEVPGIKFQQADEVARRLDLDLGNPLRLRGAVLYAAKTQRGMGHLYLTSAEMVGSVQSLVPDVEPKAIGQALAALHKEGLLEIDRKTRPGTTAIYEPWLLNVEQRSAELLRDRVRTAVPDVVPVRMSDKDNLSDSLQQIVMKPYPMALAECGSLATAAYQSDPSDVVAIAKAALEDWSDGSHMSLSTTQLRGALNALTQPVSILTGLPGTGKTTALKAVVSVLKDAGIPFLLCAPTGIAAKRLSSVTNAPASTIHRAFSAKGWATGQEREATYTGVVGDSDADSSDGSGEAWGFDKDNPHPAQVVLCDEISMVDQHLLFRLLSCTSPKCRLVFVGDAAQLPSVGPGNVLRDMIQSGFFPTVSLTDIFRQGDLSDIISAAHATHRGEIPEYGMGPGSDFVLVPKNSEDEILEVMLNLAQKLYARKDNFQIISPRHSGILGVTNLNERLREILNPKAPGLQEMRLGSDVIREDDRVMVVKNNYKHDIFNGDVGKVLRLDRKASEMEIKLHGPPVLHVRLEFKEAPSHLRLAYAMTVHKCVHPDTLVETAEGLLPIREIAGTGWIATPDGQKRYRNKVVNPEGPAIRLRTRGGYTLTVTPDHGVDVWDGERYVRREAGEIQKGDILRLRLGTTREPCYDSSLLLPEAPPHDVRARVYRTPARMDDNVAEFLGLMVADGTLYHKGFRLAKRHEDTVRRFVELCHDLFGVEARVFHTKGAYHAEVNSTFLSSWLSSVGGMQAHEKTVPSCVLRTPSRVQAHFLRGLFADGAVNIKGGQLDHIEWTCKLEGLSNMVRTMLLRLGIACGTTRNRRLHTVYIYGEYAKRFGQLVGFPSSFKQDRLGLPCGKQSKYFIPVSKDEARSLREHHVEVLGRSVCRNMVTRGRLSLRSLARLNSSGAGSEVASTVRERARWLHEPVVSVEPTLCESMCVEVPENHQFLQNGFSAWNCQGQEYDVIVLPIHKSFSHQLQRNLFYTAITRAKKKVILVGQHEALVRSVFNNKEDARNTMFRERLEATFSQGGS